MRSKKLCEKGGLMEIFARWCQNLNSENDEPTSSYYIDISWVPFVKRSPGAYLVLPGPSF